MSRLPDCAIFPAGQWYLPQAPADDTEQLECFCTQFRAVMFKHGMLSILAFLNLVGLQYANAFGRRAEIERLTDIWRPLND